MSTAIIVDAACDLPVDFCKQHSIHIVPINVVFSDKSFLDFRDPETTREFYKDYSHFRACDVYTMPPSIELIQDFLVDRIAKNYEQAIFMCLTGSRSTMYDTAIEAATLTRHWINSRQGKEDFLLKTLRIMDTRTVFTGQALLAYEAFRMTSQTSQITMQDLYEVLRVMSVNVRVYTIPHDLYYVKTRGKLRGERSIGGWAYLMGKTFNMKPIVTMQRGVTRRIAWGKGFYDAVRRIFVLAKKAIDSGLMINAVMVSYAGNTREIMALDCYRDLRVYAEKNGVQVHLSIMSTAAGINVGPGAITVAFCN